MSDAARLLDALTRRGERLATAESLTGGLLAAEIVAVPGASNAFSGGVVAYGTELKHSIVGVDADLLAVRGAVDADVACQLADRVRLVCAVEGRPADVGIATTGVAGPDPQDGHAPGTVFVGIASARGIRSVRLELGGDRESVRRATVAAALALALEDFDSDAE